ncbi:MAG: hypothetical protein FWE05_13825 [Defluviitaleaceae bacterium]|nr:hypothetical protein [Defluviitaleaceae bacterium]
MRVHVFDKLFDEVPNIDDVKGLRILPLDYPMSTRDLCMSMWLSLFKKKEYPENYLTYLGNTDIPANIVRKQSFSSNAWWNSIEWWSEYFVIWQGIEYKIIEEGVFKYTHHQ